jgi:hypothetical protein
MQTDISFVLLTSRKVKAIPWPMLRSLRFSERLKHFSLVVVSQLGE